MKRNSKFSEQEASAAQLHFSQVVQALQENVNTAAQLTTPPDSDDDNLLHDNIVFNALISN